MRWDLDELRNQRKLIARHLEWLDHRIKECENGKNTEEPPSASDAIAPETALQNPPPLSETPEKSHYPSMPAPAFSPQRAKLGCIGLIILACAIVLFLLFVLPNYIY